MSKAIKMQTKTNLDIPASNKIDDMEWFNTTLKGRAMLYQFHFTISSKDAKNTCVLQKTANYYEQRS